MAPAPLIDLHMHSNASDGALSPAAVMHYAAEHGVQHVALTDHDTLSGLDAAAAAAQSLGLRFTPGVELSCQWQGRCLHVLGLGFDPTRCDTLPPHLQALASLRITRLQKMAERLERKLKRPIKALVEDLLRDTPLATRLHLAKALLSAGYVDTLQEAFDRWLGQGKPAYVAEEWPTLEATVAVLKGCGAVAVLAHPHRYRVSNGGLSRLIAEFTALGGVGIEVSIGGMARGDLDRLATLARRHRLAASTGSDFHDPTLPWHRPGRFAKLPDDLEHVAAQLP